MYLTKYVYRAGLALLVTAALGSQAWAGAWTTGGPGHLLLQLGNTNYIASDQFDGNANTTPIQIFQYIQGTPFAGQVNSTYHSHDLSLYLELGLLDSLDLIAYFPFYKTIAQTYPDNPDFSVTGISDGNVWLKAKFLDNKYMVLALKGGLEIPVGDPNAGQNYPDPFTSKRLPIPLGDHELAGDISLLASHSFYPVSLFISAELGGRFRGSHKYGDSLITYANEILFDFNLGYQLMIRKYIWCWLPQIDFILSFHGVGSVGNGRIDGPKPQGYSYNLYLPVDQTYLNIGPIINFHLWKYFFFNVRYERVIWGKNTGVGDIVGAGIGFNR